MSNHRTAIYEAIAAGVMSVPLFALSGAAAYAMHVFPFMGLWFLMASVWSFFGGIALGVVCATKVLDL